MALTWTIWQQRNKIVFSNDTFNGSKRLDDAIFLLWTWLRNTEKDFVIHFNQWSSNLREVIILSDLIHIDVREEMVSRGSYSSSSLLTGRFHARKLSPSIITFYTMFIFAFSIFMFFFYVRHISVDEDPPLPLLSQQSKSYQVPELPVHYKQLWDTPFNHGLHQCVKPTTKYKAAQGFDRYLTVRSNGGLNQMRTGISDMVAVAHIMNATLVIPQLDKRSFWNDSSVFSDVFDELHFIKSLKGDIRIVSELPKNLEGVPRARKHFTSWSGVGYYEEMTRLWSDYQVIHVAKSDSRLANNDLPLDIQRLRCRAMYHALRFSPPIENLGKVLSIHDGYKTEVGGSAEITWRKIYSSPSEI
ncbi:O-fucosyltransferase 38 [Glycine max]|nr:O-fucosyltransferase 38 [Glycine max]